MTIALIVVGMMFLFACFITALFLLNKTTENNKSAIDQKPIAKQPVKRPTTPEDNDSAFIKNIQSSKIYPRKLWNQSEIKAFKLLNTGIKNRYSGKYLVHSQVSMGEFLGCDNNFIYTRAINSKRVDFLITDQTGQSIAVIEIQGSGHLTNKSDIERNHIKQLVVKKASIKLIELFPENDLKQQVISEVFRFLDQASGLKLGN